MLNDGCSSTEEGTTSGDARRGETDLRTGGGGGGSGSSIEHETNVGDARRGETDLRMGGGGGGSGSSETANSVGCGGGGGGGGAGGEAGGEGSCLGGAVSGEGGCLRGAASGDGGAVGKTGTAICGCMAAIACGGKGFPVANLRQKNITFSDGILFTKSIEIGSKLEHGDI